MNGGTVRHLLALQYVTRSSHKTGDFHVGNFPQLSTVASLHNMYYTHTNTTKEQGGRPSRRPPDSPAACPGNVEWAQLFAANSPRRTVASCCTGSPSSLANSSQIFLASAFFPAAIRLRAWLAWWLYFSDLYGASAAALP